MINKRRGNRKGFQNSMRAMLTYCSLRRVFTSLLTSAAIKTSSSAEMMVVFEREQRNHELPGIAASPYIRSLIDIVDSDTTATLAPQPRCMAFEWMDTDIWSLSSEQYRSSKLPKIIAKSVLRALITIKEKGAVHTGMTA